jgi:hypothetical protein
VKKLGADVLDEIIPILQQRVTSADANVRVGVCLGLRCVHFFVLSVFFLLQQFVTRADANLFVSDCSDLR